MESQIGMVPEPEQAQYRVNGTNLRFVRGVIELNGGETGGDVQTVKAMNLAMDQYTDALVTLEQENLKWKKKIEARSLEMTIEILRGLSIMSATAQQRLQALPQLLKDLERELKVARRAVQGARAQLVLDGVIDAVALAYPPASLLAKVVRPALIQGVHMGLDRALGPSHDKWGDINVTVGGVIESVPELCHSVEHWKHVGSTTVALVTTGLDVKELIEAHVEVEKLDKNVEHAFRELEWLERNTATMVPKLKLFREGLDAAIRAKADADTESDYADQEVRRIKTSIRQLK
jgi:GrpB-like predicted nucleotidyltransferase (UPF0157 family)